MAIRYLYSRNAGQNAEDICQEVSQKLAKQQKKGKTINAGYIWISFRNMAIDYHRREKARRNKQEKFAEQKKRIEQKESLKTGLHKLSQESKVHDKIHQRIDKFGLKERVILKLRTHPIHKFTFAEIAYIIGCSESTARMRYHELEEEIMKLFNEND